MEHEQLHSGHRKRMLEKAKSNASSLSEHELLEIFLYRIMPRVNTNPIAHRLLRMFGSLYGVLNASVEQLQTVQGVGEKIATELHLLGKMFFVVKKQEKKIKNAQSFANIKDDVIDEFRDCTEEKGVIYFLDAKYNVLHEMPYLFGTATKVSLDASEILSCFIIHKPKFLLVAHNHPSGNMEPSLADDEATKKFNIVCSIHGVSLVDHVIVCGNEAFSYCSSGRLDKIKKESDVEGLLR